jgi:hypothetical protein
MAHTTPLARLSAALLEHSFVFGALSKLPLARDLRLVALLLFKNYPHNKTQDMRTECNNNTTTKKSRK